MIGVNTTAQAEFLSQISSGQPAWSTVSGQYLCAPAVFAPATAATLTVSGTAFTAFGSGTATTNSFIAPTSGSVTVTASFVAEASSGSATAMAFALSQHGTVSSTSLFGNVVNFTDTATVYRPYTIPFIVGGLTAGSTYQFDLIGAVSAGNLVINAFGTAATAPTLTTHAAPVVMTVQAV
jgi:hypothetical protein